MTLGNRIKKARERLRPKISQQDVADRFGISDKAVSAWERDETTPEYEKFPKLRKILRVTYVWLHEGTGEPPAPDDPAVRFEDMAAELEAQRPPKNPAKPRRTG